MGLKVQIRIERDKSHFVKKSFNGIDGAIGFLEAVKREKTKRQLQKWLWFEELSDFENGGKQKNAEGEKDLRLTCNTSEETITALRQAAKQHRPSCWKYKHFMSVADDLERLLNETKRKCGNAASGISVGKKN